MVQVLLDHKHISTQYGGIRSYYPFTGLVIRAVGAIRVTRGGLEPSANFPRRIFPTTLTGDVTSKIAEDDWERG